MLTLLDRASSRRHCDGVSRRTFLTVGGLGLAGLSLPQLLAAEDAQGGGSSHKSVILIYLCGGPPHQDTYEIKEDAPAEIRGPFRAIDTAAPGVRICEHLPRLAEAMPRFSIVRSLVGSRDSHYSYQCMTGHHDTNEPAGGWPHFGSVVSHYQGPVHPGVPPFVSLCYTTQHRPYNEPGPGFLGLGHQSFRPTGPSRDDMVLQGVTTDRLDDRRRLLQAVDRFRRHWDSSGKMDGMDVFTERALGILTSSQLFDALDISKEPQAIRERYGEADLNRPFGDGAPRTPQNFLIARRLVEAGVRVVTINYSFWDWHGDNFRQAKDELPVFDQAVTALVEDLHQRGMENDVTVLAWGEFGRTPTINDKAGRDHWPRVASCLLAGGGMRTGQAIGATDRLGGEASERPVTHAEIFATLCHNLGIRLESQRLFDFRGRPQAIVDSSARPLPELV